MHPQVRGCFHCLSSLLIPYICSWFMMTSDFHYYCLFCYTCSPLIIWIRPARRLSKHMRTEGFIVPGNNVGSGNSFSGVYSLISIYLLIWVCPTKLSSSIRNANLFIGEEGLLYHYHPLSNSLSIPLNNTTIRSYFKLFRFYLVLYKIFINLFFKLKCKSKFCY